MKKWLQRIRGAVGIGLTWAAGWAPIGAITGWLTALAFGFPLGAVTVNYAVMFGVMGFMGGSIFSTVLSLAEGRRSFGHLSLPRFVAWGASGGLVLGGLAVTAGLLGSGLTVLGGVVMGALTLLGAGSAAGTLVIARAAHGQSCRTIGTMPRSQDSLAGAAGTCSGPRSESTGCTSLERRRSPPSSRRRLTNERRRA